MDHEPDSQFVEHLEWQIRSSLRRRDRFALPVPSGALRMARTAALVMLSLMGGAGAVVAAERIQDSRAKELLLAQTSIEVEMAEMQLEFVNKSRQRMQQLVELGVAGPSNVLEAEAEVARSEADLKVLHLDVEEISVTGEYPRNEISAPRVRGVDFVTLRIQARLPELEKQVEIAQQILERRRALVESGMLSPRELFDDERMLSDSRGELEILLRRLAIRSSFLSGEYSAEHVQLLDLEATTVRRLQMAEEELVPLRSKLEHAVMLEEAGMASNESPRVQLELELLQRRIDLLNLELSALHERLGR